MVGSLAAAWEEKQVSKAIGELRLCTAPSALMLYILSALEQYCGRDLAVLLRLVGSNTSYGPTRRP